MGLFQLGFGEFHMLTHYWIVFFELQFFRLFLWVALAHVKEPRIGGGFQFYQNSCFFSHKFLVNKEGATYGIFTPCQAWLAHKTLGTARAAG
jgi:hypothetical protein